MRKNKNAFSILWTAYHTALVFELAIVIVLLYAILTKGVE
jgi:hypothetical protein